MPVLKPLREFVSKEITFYNQLKSIAFYEGPNFGTKQNKKSSLGKLTESFISGLQKDFPATVYTIYKIATKIEPKHLPGKCILCSVSRRIYKSFMRPSFEHSYLLLLLLLLRLYLDIIRRRTTICSRKVSARHKMRFNFRNLCVKVVMKKIATVVYY